MAKEEIINLDLEQDDERIAKKKIELATKLVKQGRKKRVLKTIGIICVLFPIMIFAANWYVEIDTNSLPNEVSRSKEINIPTAYLRGRWFLKDGMIIKTDCEEIHHSSKIGKYTNKYSASFLFYHAEARKTYDVVDDVPPIIELTHVPGYVIKFDEEYVEEGFVAFDDYDGILTKSVTSEMKDGLITYSVFDSSGNYASVTREIQYADMKPPIITLNGENPMTLYVGMDYQELGAIAIDENDGDVTEFMLINHNINTDEVGEYEVQYIARDMYDNESIAKRTIKVIDAPREEKVIYLTFDDGPGPYTEELLDVLDAHNIKATFFVCNSNKYNHLLSEIVKRGHAIGVHSKTHKYDVIYKDVESFMDDIYSMQNIIETHTGVKTMLMRFPGGGSNIVSKQYAEGIMTDLVQKVDESGFQYFDWNVESGDASTAKTKSSVLNNVINEVPNHNSSVVLMHDIKEYTVKAVPDIIKWGMDNGYEFHKLNMYSPTMHHTVVN